LAEQVIPDISASARRRRRAVVVPPAAFTARFVADLSSDALMVIACFADPFEPKPGQSGPAVLLVLSRLENNFAPLPCRPGSCALPQFTKAKSVVITYACFTG
jgi:hypothetical protein